MAFPDGLTIISRIRCPHNGVRVVLGWLLVCQENTRVMIELHQDDRALDTKVEGVIVAEATDPAKVRFAKVLLDLLELELTSLGRVVKEELMAYRQDKIFFSVVQQRGANAFV